MLKFELLKKHFGYDSFRLGQESIVDHIVSGRDALAIMPTSGGKSICYQLPALMYDGITIVISPLIALMKDQVDGLLENGIPATFINSSLSASETNHRNSEILNGQYKIVYVAPERLLTEGFIKLANRLEISFVAIDEAHCISQWGHDFRPSYKDIPQFITRLEKRPVIAAFTATATSTVIQEIKTLLKLKKPFEVITGFDRPNLHYKVIKPIDKYKNLCSYILDFNADESGIIYCSTRKTVESLKTKMKSAGFSVDAYHAGMDHNSRNKVQNDFMMDRTKVIIATNAFGMGIDKPDVRFVIHYNMPQNMEAYYQEAGRAGRDGLKSDCILMYSPADIVKQKMIIAMNTNTAERDQMLIENLQKLVNYCHTNDCLRNEITSYFGESITTLNCGSCGNCTEDFETVDMTIESQKILSCIYRTNQRFGVNVIIQVLRGSKNKKIIDWNLDQVSTYGIITEYSEGALRELIMNLIARGFINMTADAFPVLKLDESSRNVLKGLEKIVIRKEHVANHDKKKTSSSARKSKKKSSFTGSNSELLSLLFDKRKSIAEAKKLPAYVIFHNAALEEMAESMPLTKSDFLEIKGVGEKKFETYGLIFMDIIQKFSNK